MGRRLPLLLILLLAFTALAQGPPVVYICPMHPDVQQAKPGNCPICNMRLVPSTPGDYAEYNLKVESVPPRVVAGRPFQLRFAVRHPRTGELIRDFTLVHEKLLHLFIVSQNLEYFAHVHPEPQPDGSFELTATLPRPGAYMLIADFLPEGGAPQFIQHSIITAGYNQDLAPAHLAPDREWVQVQDGVRVEFARQPLIAGQPMLLHAKLTDAQTGQPVTDLEQYIGAWAHLLILSDDLADAIHVHPAPETKTGGPEILFDARFPRPGNYKMWVQFQRHGKVITTAFTVHADRLGADLLK